jgi:L-rhamnose-H+ transport protein
VIANPLLGVLFHWLGGLSSASFYVPYRGVGAGRGKSSG